MKTLILAACLSLAACAHTKAPANLVEMSFPDGSEKAPLWTCAKGEPGKVVCMDFRTSFLFALSQIPPSKLESLIEQTHPKKE